MYLYHANAIALGIGNNAHAVCALPYTGGRANLQPITHNSDGISCKIIKSEVEGGEHQIGGKDVYVTSASVELADVNILNLLKADHIRASIISTHRDGESDPVIDTSASHFDNLQVAGHPIKVDWAHTEFQGFNTYRNMQKSFMGNKDSVTKLMVGCKLTDNSNEDLQCAVNAYSQQQNMEQLGLTVVCSLVKSVIGLNGVDNIKACGSIITLPDARIYLGELVVWPWMRCLNMFRIERGDSQPRISGATVGANGSTYPPGGDFGPPLPGGGYGPPLPGGG